MNTNRASILDSSFFVFYRSMWLVMCIICLSWGAFVGFSLPTTGIGSTIVTGTILVVGLILTLFVAGRNSTKATIKPRQERTIRNKNHGGWQGPATWVIPSSEDTAPLTLDDSFDPNILTDGELLLAFTLNMFSGDVVAKIPEDRRKAVSKLKLNYADMGGLSEKLEDYYLKQRKTTEN